MKKSIVIFFFIIFFYLYKIGDIPNGLFADEAEIGYRSYQLIHGDSSFLVTPFFYHHFNYILGALPIYATSPFIAMFGLSEFSVRFSSATYSILTLIIIYLIFKKLKITYIWQSILLFSFTPIYFHISRINFGHMPSIFLLFLGYLLFLNLIEKPSIFLVISSALIISISSYGYGTFMITSPIFMTLISIWHLFKYRHSVIRIKSIILFIAVFIIGFLPIPITYFTNADFRIRINEKSGNKQESTYSKVLSVIKNYPKYYSIDYLFTKGEVDMPGGFVKRHSVQGNGILLLVSVIVFFGSFIHLARIKNKFDNPILLFLIILSIYPISDILFTDLNKPPYTFAVFSLLTLCLPLLISYGFEGLFSRKYKIIIYSINIIILIQAVLFLNNYYKYPLYSSDYWGWQYGPKEIISYFKENNKKYDELYMIGDFNAPDIFKKFYDLENNCKNCFIGGKDRYDINKKQLFALTPTELEKISWKYHIQKVIKYPNQRTAFIIIKH
ncbi:hypothetical protein COT02_01720 [Candidatus Roizmanbacteria bacterium CG07_land_8_20_14_0_80_34_15]|uniref:Glycosyltransferase RgtA/B/C/D-like domain-containing protein n=1 Tax=Candidatus Roizmanbacteria bacterium CG07_land_8_20_14_0_80_34_15 TaxID=1974849 RepID=A0A2M6YUV5_9BACT|nr:MAG: hypothetical protein COT02_01720 [Candidatus Roizmanbacteria bacterium CG07_land_8_20_14_0_80_34_15]